MTPTDSGDVPHHDETDIILDEIDQVLDETAEEFVRGFVEKGGQGQSFLLSEAFYISAAAQGVIGNASYEIFRAVIVRVIKALRQVPGPHRQDSLRPDGSPDFELEETLRRVWNLAVELTTADGRVEHTTAEYTALHSALYSLELQKSLHIVRLSPEQYDRVARAGTAVPEQLSPSQLVAKIVDQWLKKNPHSDIGLF